mgnify:CR=1 FL=1
MSIAGAIIAMELGAVVTDIGGRSLTFQGGRMLRAGVLVASKAEHADLLGALTAVRQAILQYQPYLWFV